MQWTDQPQGYTPAEYALLIASFAILIGACLWCNAVWCQWSVVDHGKLAVGPWHAVCACSSFPNFTKCLFFGNLVFGVLWLADALVYLIAGPRAPLLCAADYIPNR